MEVINGTDIIIVVETSSGKYKPIAGAKSFSISVNRNIRDVSHKHIGAASASEYGRYNWSVTIDGLKSFVTSYVSHDWFLQKQLAKEKVKFICAPLDYETAGKAPLSQSTELDIVDSGDLAVIDDSTTSIQVEDDHVALTSVIAAITPKANYGLAVIESVESTAGDDDDPTFSVSLKGDKYIKQLSVTAYGGFSPLSISGLKFWYDATDAATVQLSGVNVTQWDDKGPNGYDLTQGSVPNRPIYSAVNKRITFANANSTYLDSGALTLSQPYTLVVVYKKTIARDIGQYVTGCTGATVGGLIGTGTSGTGKFVGHAGTVLTQGDNDISDDHIHIVEYDGLNGNYWLDSDIVVSGDIGAGDMDSLEVGGYNGGLAAIDAEVMEVIGYDGAVSSGDRASLIAYLNTKHSI